MAWPVIFTETAERDARRLDEKVRRRIFIKIAWLSANVDRVHHLPLSGRLKGFLKLRVGELGIVYEIEVLQRRIVIHAIDRRDSIYRRRT